MNHDNANGRKDQRTQALGRAWLQPERTAEFARQGKLDLQTLIEHLRTDEGATEAEAAALELRRSGDFISERSLELMELLLDQIEKLIQSEDLSVNSAAKLLDTVYKVTGIAAARDFKAQENARVCASKFSITFNLGAQAERKPSGVTIDAVNTPAPFGRLLDSINKPFVDDRDAEDSAAQSDTDDE